MSAHQFDAALAKHDGDALFRHIYDLTAHSAQCSGLTLPITAANYLRAFCNVSSPAIRRRWIGVALRKMVRTSKDVVEHLKTLHHDLTQLGQVILGSTELEETRILAGAIIREALQQGIEFPQFWPSDKVPKNVPNFPEKARGWMSQFQKFLDTLGDLVMMDMAIDPAILFPVSLIASDGFKWHSDDVGIIAIIQSGVLTIVTPDVSTPDLSFVDIPLHHIQSVHTRKSILHDSQARGTKHEPWDLIMSLRPSSWTYRVNTSEHMGNEFTILFVNAKTAEECRTCIMESINLESQGSKMSVSQPLFLGPDEAWSDQVPSKAKDNTHGEEHVLVITPENLDDAQGSSAVETYSQSRNDAGATVDPGTAATTQTGPEPSGLIEISSTTSSTEDESSSPDTERRPEPPLVVEQPTKAPQEADAKKPPKMNKRTRKSNSAVDPPVEDDHIDELDFPGESQRMKRPSAVSKKGASNAPARETATKPSASLGRIPKVKPIESKPKSKLEPSTLFNDTEDEEDLISSQPVVRPLGRSRTNGNAATRPTQSPAQSVEPAYVSEKSKGGSRLSGLPKIMKAVEKTSSTNKRRPESDVWAIPQENETTSRGLPKISKSLPKSISTKVAESSVFAIPRHDEQQENGESSRKRSLDKKTKDRAPSSDKPKGKLRARRTVVKKVNYKDSESSTSESSASEGNESDYFDAGPKKSRSVAKATTQPKGSVIRKVAAAKASGIKPKLGRNKATASKAAMSPISPEKHSVLAGLLNKSRAAPIRESKDHTVRAGRAPLGKKTSERDQGPITAPELESPALASPPVRDSDDLIAIPPDDKEGQPAIPSKQNISAPEADVQIVIPPKPNVPILESDSPFGEFIDFDGGVNDITTLLVNKAVTSVPGLGDDTLRPASRIDAGTIAQVSAKPTTISTSKRKRTAEGTPPSTPGKKRTKTELTGGEIANKAEPAGAFKFPTTISRPRVLCDPVSPLVDQWRASVRSSIQETVQTLQALQHEHNSSPALPAVSRVQESHALGSIKWPQRRHTPLNQHAQRNRSVGSANAEILSSNSKPIPASPNAESVAISGHADNDHVNLEKQLGDAETARSDPFANRRTQASNLTAFTRRLTEESASIDESQMLEPEISSDRSPERPVMAVDLESPVNNFRDSGRRSQHVTKPLSGLSNSIRVRAPSLVKATKQPVQAPQDLMQEAQQELLRRRTVVFEDTVVDAPSQAVDSTQPQEQIYNHDDDGDVAMEGDETLVAMAETPASYKASPLHFQSSPPGDYTPSSHSSTSAEPEPESEIPFPTDEMEEMEEMEWEASLQPHQRSVHDQLIRVSKHVVRQVVDKETAIDDIAEMYAKDGEHLLNTLVERHSGEFESMLKDVEKKKDDMRSEYEGLAKRLMRERAKYGPKT
jgi:hypothetical protein